VIRVSTTTAGREIGTAKKGRSAGAVATSAVLLLAATACGGSKQESFSWLKPRPVPSSWTVTRIPSGSELGSPPGWRRLSGDRGTASAALLGPGGRYLGYLNVTPKQGGEGLSGWAAFRVSHNADEGDRHVVRVASATGLRFLRGTGSCVEDSYTTTIGSRYIELACIVKSGARTSVIVGAASPSSWARVSPLLERAIQGFRA
jgi:hypothetical protein